MKRRRFVEDNLDWLVPFEENQPDESYVPGPPAQEPDADEEEAQQRAAGGRVVATNIDPNPSEAQKDAGNYAKEHVNVKGLSITIENAKGSKRSGVGKDGQPWECTLPADYGYLKRTESADGDHIDVYLGPHRASPHVFVIDQVDADTGKFDEHKVGLGFASKEQYLRTYEKAFSDGKAKARISTVKELNLGDFKHWLESGDTKKPIDAHDFRKMSHEKAAYVFPSKKEARCATCTMYVKPADGGPACTLVANPILPGAWCKYYE